MYSVVMMMAMTGTPDLPAFGKRRNGCDGGCNGGYAGSCYGGGGCQGYADSCGCSGGGRHSRRDRRGCNGGGCHGYSSGCCGQTNNCCQQQSCGCCGQMASGCGCSGGYGYGGMMTAPPPASTPAPPAMPPKDGKPGNPTEARIAAPATIIVSLPAEASLKIDGVTTKQVSSLRQFTTPTLVAGQSYFYTLTAEVVQEGRTLTSVQTIAVRAGEQTNVALSAEQFAQTIAMK
jgi:uncharacterized protein (TIGR03000 family)